MKTINTTRKTKGKIKIATKDLNFSVPSKQILHNVSLQVEENKIVGLIGPNGSGKTSLLKHIYRALDPEKKTVYINSTEIEKFSYRETARQITVMRQGNSSDFDYTILEMVLMSRSFFDGFFEMVRHKFDKEKAHETCNGYL